MGFNVSGLIVKPRIDEKLLEHHLGEKLNYINVVGIEEATSGLKNEGTVDVYYGDKATLVFTAVGTMYDLNDFLEHGEVVQFIVSETSDTYYFEKFLVGELERKYIVSQGTIQENVGDGVIDEKEDIVDQIWDIASDYLGFELFEGDVEFKRYQ